MLAGLKEGKYAAENRLMAFTPCNVTLTQLATLFWHVSNAYESYRRVIESIRVGVAFCVPQTLETPSRNKRPVCRPVDVVTPGAGAGNTVSSVVVILKGGGPIGTVKRNACGLGPPVEVTVRVKEAALGQGKSLAIVKR